MEEIEAKRERGYCSRLGLALLLVIVWALVWQFALLLLDGMLPVRLPDSVFYLLILAGHYAVSLPAAYALCRRVPRTPPARRPAGARRMARWFVIGAALMWLGSLAGTAVNNLAYRLAGREPVDLLSEAFDLYSPAVILLGACLLGPVCEELLFRGLLAGRLARYGQKPAALVSALLFGLFHANLGQFFYAFALGLLLAYAYFRTGGLAAPIVLHMLFNVYGSGLPTVLPAGDGPLLLYGLSWLALTAAGVALLIGGRKKQVWEHGPCAPSMRAVFVNCGMLLAVAACFIELALNFVLV
ncbi:MAG: type II CAAX endopeptidase family protein [Eubacteriales bacterium]|nr:type II CAAX endopeptidase family protein [Eubacteriales bacterium]